MDVPVHDQDAFAGVGHVLGCNRYIIKEAEATNDITVGMVPGWPDKCVGFLDLAGHDSIGCCQHCVDCHLGSCEGVHVLVVVLVKFIRVGSIVKLLALCIY